LGDLWGGIGAKCITLLREWGIGAIGWEFWGIVDRKAEVFWGVVVQVGDVGYYEFFGWGFGVFYSNIGRMGC
jgi:hypothetical protein